MIVLLIIGATLTLGIQQFGGQNQKVKKDVRKISVLIRRLYQAAQLQNKTYRLVLEMRDSSNDEQESSSFWVESLDGKSYIVTHQQETEKYEGLDEEEAKSKRQSGFQMDSRYLKRKTKLPEGFYFTKTEYGNREQSEADNSYIYFFPQGMTEEAIIHIENPKLEIFWSILSHPLTGHTKIFPKSISIDDIKQAN